MEWMNDGYCPVCEDRVTFVAEGDWLRDTYVHTRWRTIPRRRALLAGIDPARLARSRTWNQRVLRDRRIGIDGEYLEVFVHEREELNRTRIGRGDAQ